METWETVKYSMKSYYNLSNVCVFVTYLLRGPLTDLRQTWWVYVGGPRNCPWGVLFRKGQRVTFTFHYIIYAPASRHTLQKAPFALLALLQSLIRCLLLRCISTAYVGGPPNCYWGVLFLKDQRVDGSTGQRVNGSNGSMGQRVTFTFTILYMIADDARLTPSRCKKHTAYDDARLTPHRCKKHTASFARSTGKFPSTYAI